MITFEQGVILDSRVHYLVNCSLQSLAANSLEEKVSLRPPLFQYLHALLPDQDKCANLLTWKMSTRCTRTTILFLRRNIAFTITRRIARPSFNPKSYSVLGPL